MLTFQRFVAACLIVMQIIFVFLGFLHGQVVGFDLFGRNLKEGNPCTMKDGSPGACTKLPECETLYNGLIKRKIPYSSIVRCSFIGATEVVCCGDRQPTVINKPIEQTNPDQVVFVSTTARVLLTPETTLVSRGQEQYTDTTLFQYESNLRNHLTGNEMRTEVISENQGPLHQNPAPGNNPEVFSEHRNDQQLHVEHRAQYSQETDNYPHLDSRFFLSAPKVLPRCNVIYFAQQTTTPSPPIGIGSRFGFGLSLFNRPNNVPTTVRPTSALSSIINLVKPIKTIPLQFISSIANANARAEVNQNNPNFATVTTTNTNMEPCTIDTVNGPQVISQPIVTDAYVIVNGNLYAHQTPGGDMQFSGNPAWVPQTQQPNLPNPGNWNNQQMTSTTYRNFPATVRTATLPSVLDNTSPRNKDVFPSTTTTRRTPTTNVTTPPTTITTTTIKFPTLDGPVWEQWTKESLSTTTTPNMFESMKVDPSIEESLKRSSSTTKLPALSNTFVPTTKQSSTLNNSNLISGFVDNLRLTTTSSPILENPILDPWMKDALLAKENQRSKPSTQITKEEVINAKPASVLDPWIAEALDNYSTTSKTSITSTTKNPIFDNPVLDPWMKEALAVTSNSTKPQIKESRATKDVIEYPPEIVSTTRSPIVDNPVLDPWMKEALLTATNSSMNGNQTVSPHKDNTSHGADHRTEQNQVTSVPSKLPNLPSKPVLDPWMQEILEQAASSTLPSVSSSSVLNPTKTALHDTSFENPTKRESSSSLNIDRPKSTDAVWFPTVIPKPPSRNDSYYPNEIYTSTDTSNRPDLETDTITPESRGSGGKADVACAQYKKIYDVSLTYHILGGTNTTIGEFPHMAALGYPSTAAGQDVEWNCGGTLISDRYVMTAAHCINPSGPTIIRLGKVTLDSDSDGGDPVDLGVNDIIMHPRYKTSRQYDDIALIRLNDTIDFTDSVRPACLNTDTDDIPPDTTVVVTGWGSISVSLRSRSNILLKANLTTVEVRSCNQSHLEYLRNRKLPQGLNEGHLCAYDPELKKDTCEGDSGGPLQIVDRSGLSIIYGITSFGVGCASKIPAVYAKVSYYVDWIESVVWP